MTSKQYIDIIVAILNVLTYKYQEGLVLLIIIIIIRILAKIIPTGSIMNSNLN